MIFLALAAIGGGTAAAVLTMLHGFGYALLAALLGGSGATLLAGLLLAHRRRRERPRGRYAGEERPWRHSNAA
ncbi:hypothetical protein [Methylobacterium oryzisoli]|uniref:hypothetical protein n=1 Tax=Methylobacterium oryzisoli TaxID=3385502 RepID=UPI0038921E44